MPLLSVKNLDIAIAMNRELLPVVQDVSFDIEAGNTLGIVGESGCGKSVTALAIMGLLDDSRVHVTGGAIEFAGSNLLEMSANERRHLMGNDMAMIFQEPMTSLNPVYPVGEQIIEVLRQHRSLSRTAARARAIELLELVQIPDAGNRVDSYPHQLSGGQRQRVMIAMGLSCEPQLLIADEPTTALDVTVQKEVLDLIVELQDNTGTAIMLISHDLGVIAETSDHVAVMYCGRIVEAAPVADLFNNISHPYTRGLLDSIPPIESDAEWLKTIAGRVPTLDEGLSGCSFHPRCNHTQDICKQRTPPTSNIDATHQLQCHFGTELSL